MVWARGVGDVLQDAGAASYSPVAWWRTYSAPMLSWFQQLDTARNPAEVVAVTRDYVATWSPEELARLPRTCRPGRLRTPEDIEELHACAVDAYRSTRASGYELTALQLITSFLVRASIRLAQLRAPQADDPSADVSSTNPPRRQSQARDR